MAGDWNARNPRLMRILWARFLVWVIRHLPRDFAIAVGLRRLSPLRGIAPWAAHTYESSGDTGGGWRPDFRPQAPNKDPQEPNGGEGGSKGDEHAWNNCTMSSGALALAYEQEVKSGKWGGHLRHKQGDLSGGTDLYDLQDAWQAYGEELKIKSGQGWSVVKEKHAENRCIVIQGEGQCPGSGTFTGAHACIIGPETNSGEWLWGDPLTNNWQNVPPAKIEEWAKRFNSGISFAVGRQFSQPAPPEPEPPKPEPPKPTPPPPYVPPVFMVGWQPVPLSFAVWGSVDWDSADWYIAAGEWPVGWATKVPYWDEYLWGGSWHT